MRTKTNRKRDTVRKVLRMVNRLEPGYLPLMTVTKMLAAVHPFWVLWFGSRILDMLLEQYEMEAIMKCVLVGTLFGGGTMILRWWLESLLGVKRRVLTEKYSKCFPKSLSVWIMKCWRKMKHWR